MQQAFHLHQLVALAFEHFRHRDAGPLRHNFSDFFFSHLAAQQLVLALAVLVDHLQAAFQIRDHPVLQFSHTVEVTFTARGFQFLPRLLDLLLNLRRTLHLGFFRVPDFFQIGILAFEADDFFLEFLQTFHRRFVAFFLQRLGFHLQLNQATFQTIEHFRLGVDFHADAAGGLVDQIDGLVR
ncbi:hypothetical protein D3C86_504210 [compost metagenome]